MIKLAIFDLDGTLVDSIHDIAVSANHVVKSYGRDPFHVDEIKKFIGDGLKAFVTGLAGSNEASDELLKKVSQEFASHYDAQLLKNTRFYPGVQSFFEKFKRHPERKIAVVTNKPENHARIILRHLGYGDNYFVEIFGGDRFEVKKPHPKPLIEMMRLANATPEQTVMIGDSHQDLGAALAAKTHFIAASFGYYPLSSLLIQGAQHFFDHFDELEIKINGLIKTY
ncbi:MAG: HAD-IA family hydrolase [Oligoflexia bacterium]|nr:HAD-IA family hydrolase [Oligoflexia bacterium]